MILYDFHLHSSFSTDSDAPLQEMIEEAQRQELSGVCVTEHLDRDFVPEPGLFEADPGKVLQEIHRLQRLYGERIEILFGMELGLQEHLGPYYENLAAAYPFDFLIASQHLVEGKDPYEKNAWTGRTVSSLLLSYYEEMYENLKKMTAWDTLAHLDYIIRYVPEGTPEGEKEEWDKINELLPEILRLLIMQGKCLEINTAGLRTSIKRTNPSRELISLYRDLGGRKLTIGSDAHDPAWVGYGFEKARKMLKELGFSAYSIFRGRKETELPL